MNNDYDQVIRSHYDEVAIQDKDQATSTMANLYVRDAETVFIKNTIESFTETKKDSEVKVLDVGCGNGYTLEQLSSCLPNLSYAGLEFTDSLRNIANSTLSSKSIDVKGGDIRDKKSLNDYEVDILICQRVIINLLDQADQETALKNLVEIVKDGGLLIFIECFQSGLDSLNKAREEFKIEPLPPAHHNLYLNDEFFNIPSLEEFDLSQKEFLSSHYFVSRVIHQYYLNLGGLKFHRNSEFVSFMTDAMPDNIGTYSPIKFCSYKKSA